MKVLITGAAGRIGRTLAEGLASAHQLRLADLRPNHSPDADWIECDVTDAGAAARAVEGMDAVIHLAGHPNSTDWNVVQSLNVGGTLAMLRAASAAGARRFLLASSIHVCGLHPADVPLSGDLAPLPDGPYGLSKLQTEILARYFATMHGLTAIAMRICSFRPEPTNARELATWISPADMVRLASACLTAEVEGYHEIWGVSANAKARVRDSSWAALGYSPRDDASEHADRLKAAGVDVSCFSEWPYLGGAFVDQGRTSI